MKTYRTANTLMETVGSSTCRFVMCATELVPAVGCKAHPSSDSLDSFAVLSRVSTISNHSVGCLAGLSDDNQSVRFPLVSENRQEMTPASLNQRISAASLYEAANPASGGNCSAL